MNNFQEIVNLAVEKSFADGEGEFAEQSIYSKYTIYFLY